MLRHSVQLLRRNGAITLYFKVNIFRLSRQLKPGKICGYVQVIDIAEYLGRFKLIRLPEIAATLLIPYGQRLPPVPTTRLPQAYR